MPLLKKCEKLQYEPTLRRTKKTSTEDKQILFDNTCSIPTSRQKYVKHEQEGCMVVQFLQDYFTVYDSNNRENLENAYKDSAVMSMSAVGSFTSMGHYIPHSRNLTRVAQAKTDKLLRRGRRQIMDLLKNLPKTRHDPDSFTLDVPMISSQIMSFTVTGMFEEIEAKTSRMKHFSRTFVVVPHEGGFQIINEMLFLTPAKANNAKTAFESSSSSTSPTTKGTNAAGASSSSTTVSSSLITPISTSSVQPTSQPSNPTQMELVRSFATNSGMNMEWSSKCLAENHWDFDRAAAVFAKVKAAQQIPEEAFSEEEYLSQTMNKINLI